MIEVVRCGAMTSVQDLGRPGFRHLGVGHSGAMDCIAMRQANMILGNDPAAAVVEVSVAPLVLRFTEDSSVALTGTDFTASLSAAGVGEHPQEVTAVLPGHAIKVRAGDTLTLSRPTIPGAHCYLAVAGGIDVPLVLGSRSTDLSGGFRGLAGRTLAAGDQLPVGTVTGRCISSGHGIRSMRPIHILRALPGPDWDLFTAEAQERLPKQPWRIRHQSNRMGLRLHGTSLQLRQPVELLSSGVMPGDVQVPPDGMPIVLANDAQTTGGYPRIASVIEADIWQLAHMPPSTSVFFRLVDREEAAAAMAQQQQYLTRLALTIAADVADQA